MNEEKGLPKAMRDYFAKVGKSPEEIDALAANVAKQAEAAKDAGVESKEATPEAPAAESQPDTPTFVTAQEVADAVAAITQPILDTVNNLTAQFAAVQADVKALKEADADKIAAKAAATPAMSLQALIAQSITGMGAARIDGRESLAKAGPKQAPADESNQVTPVPLINKLMAQAQGQVQQ